MVRKYYNLGNLSATTVGQRWLNQFMESDRDNARLLLDSVLFVTNHKLNAGLKNLIANFAKSHPSEPVAIFAVRENTGEAYWRGRSRPLSVCGRKEVGSEGMFSHLCRDLAKSIAQVLNHPSIKEMREAKCRYILLIDDMIGSGNRITKFAKWLYENRTLRSWHSLRYIQFMPFVYAKSDVGERYILKQKLFTNIQAVQSIGFGRSIWTEDQKIAITDLCRNYAKYTKQSKWPIGFRDAFTAIIFAHKCPNTNPAILWSSKKDSWEGIFSNRPDFLKINLNRSRGLKQQVRILQALGHTRLTKPSFFSRLNDESRELLVILSCIAVHRHHDDVLSDILEMSLATVRRCIVQCQLYGWIDRERRLTKLGKNILNAARRNDCTSVDDITCKSVFYFPQQFRSSASSSSSGLQKGECRDS